MLWRSSYEVGLRPLPKPDPQHSAPKACGKNLVSGHTDLNCKVKVGKSNDLWLYWAVLSCIFLAQWNSVQSSVDQNDIVRWILSAVHCGALFTGQRSEIWWICAQCSLFSSWDYLLWSDQLLLEARSALCSLYLEKQQAAFLAMAQGTDVHALALHIEFDETGQKLRLKRTWTSDHQTTLSVLASWLQRPSNVVGTSGKCPSGSLKIDSWLFDLLNSLFTVFTFTVIIADLTYYYYLL